MPFPWVKIALTFAEWLLFDIAVKRGRDATAKRLRGGDVFTEDVRDGIITDLREITTKLDAFAYRELKASISIIKDGFVALEAATDKTVPIAEMPNVDDEGIILALRLSVAEVNVRSEKDLNDAKDSFKTSLEMATLAFNNEGLKIQDIIVGCKLRIISRVFYHVDNVASAVKYCLNYLQELHDNQRIKSNFAVHDGGGIRARVWKSERRAIVCDVNKINYVLFNFVCECSPHTKLGVFDWPMIDLGAQRCYHPICECGDVLESSSAKVPWELAFETINRQADILAINSLGEIIKAVDNQQNIRITRLTGRSDILCSLPRNKSVTWLICSLAVDKDDNTYVTCESCRSGHYSYKLLIIARTGEVKQNTQLGFLDGKKKSVRTAITNEKTFVICERGTNDFFICDSCNGNLESRFSIPPRTFVLWNVSKSGDLILANLDMDSLFIYTFKGNRKLTIKLPEDHLVNSAAFHDPTGSIYVYTCKSKEDPTSSYILRFSEKGELLRSHSVRTWWNKDFYYLLSHPKGVITLLSHRKAIYLLLL